jgi:hypothetical protein
MIDIKGFRWFMLQPKWTESGWWPVHWNTKKCNKIYEYCRCFFLKLVFLLSVNQLDVGWKI